jgi:RNA polymerase sigma-70 factor (ECF subfamily)
MSPEDSGDHELLRAFRSGERAAHRTIETWMREIVRFRGFSLSRSEREDVVQDGIVRLWRAVSRDDFEIGTSLKGYVRRVASSACIDCVRRRQPGEDLRDDHATADPSPYEEVLASDRQAQLYWALQHLGERCRNLIQAHFFEGQPYAVIAARLGRSESTLRVHVFHCIRQARRLLSSWEGT